MFTEEELEEQHKTYVARHEMYKGYGYDIEKERLFIISAAEPIEGRILEVGTGKGYLTIEIAQKGHCLTSSDIDEQGQNIAKRNLAYRGLLDRVNFVIQNGEKMTFNDRSFEVIFCVNTLHHLKESEKVLAELDRILNIKGKLILSDFTERSFKIMDKVHESEGGKHEVVGWSLGKAAVYLGDRGLSVREVSDDYQSVIIAQKTSNGSN